MLSLFLEANSDDKSELMIVEVEKLINFKKPKKVAFSTWFLAGESVSQCEVFFSFFDFLLFTGEQGLKSPFY